jgi:hypothetical protein
MDYSTLDVDKIVEEVVKAEDEGRTRPATKQESMKVRLAALAAIVRKMQETVDEDHKMAVKERQMINA